MPAISETRPDPRSESRARLDALRELLKQGTLSTQDELREKLERLEYSVNQSTISRDLRKLGAIKALDPEGRTVYRLPDEEQEPVVAFGLEDHVRTIEHNGTLIVIHTSIGSASLVARHLDRTRPAGILGTIAGDDTIFVAPSAKKSISATMRYLEDALGVLRTQ